MRTQPSQKRSRRTVRALMRAANDEFGEHGLHGAQMTRIAQRADVSVGSMYRFFPDREAFVEALVEQYGEAMAARCREAMALLDGPETIVDVTRRLVRAAAHLQLKHAGYYRLTSAVPPESGESPGIPVRAQLMEILQAHIDVSQLAVDSQELRVVLEACLEATRARLATLPPPGELRDLLVDELEAMMVAYVRARLLGCQEPCRQHPEGSQPS